MKDAVLLAATVLAFAVVLTVHVAIAVGLLARRPRWRALAAAVVFPLAPYFALRERMRVRGALWLLSALVYVVSRLL